MIKYALFYLGGLIIIRVSASTAGDELWNYGVLRGCFHVGSGSGREAILGYWHMVTEFACMPILRNAIGQGSNSMANSYP
jgi:hypothetical protein